MGPLVAVHHRGGRVVAHAGRAHQVPPGVAQRAGAGDLHRPGRPQRLGRPGHLELGQALRVLAEAVADAGAGHPVAVGQGGVEVHPVGLLGQVLAEDGPGGPPPEGPGHQLVVLGPPRLLAGPHGQDVAERAAHRRQSPLGPPHEPPGLVGLVELVAGDAGAELALPGLQALVEPAGDHRERVHHQPLAHQAAGVGQPVGADPVVGRQQQQPSRAHRVGGQDHHLGGLVVLGPGPVDPHRAGGQPGGVDGDPAHPGPHHQPGPGRDGLGPVGQVGGGLGPLGAAGGTHAPLHAPPPAVVGGRQDGVGLGPPVPAQAVVALGHPAPGPAQRQRRQRVVDAIGVGGVAAQARDADLAVDLVVVGGQLEVVDGPVVGGAVEAADPEVAGEHPGPGPGVDHRAAAHRVEHQRGDVGLVLVDGVVGGQAAHVGAGRPALPDGQLPIALGAPEVAAVGPVALLQAHHREAPLAQVAGHDPAGRAGADDQRVGGVGHRSSCACLVEPPRPGSADGQRRSSLDTPTISSASTSRVGAWMK